MKQVLLIVLAILYALWPYDLLMDFLPGWGWLDDAALIYLAWYLYRRWRRPAGAGQRRGAGEDIRNDSSRMDPYETLGVSKTASAEEITRAYRRLAAQYHPDKVQHLGEEFKALAEKRFKEIQAAYEELKKKGNV